MKGDNMGPIIIKEENRAKITEAVEKANGKGKARLVSTDDVFGITEYITEKYGISKTAMNGCKWEVDLNAQHFPNAYKFQPLSTHRIQQRQFQADGCQEGILLESREALQSRAY